MERSLRLAAFRAYDFALCLLLIAPCRCVHCLRWQYVWIPWAGFCYLLDRVNGR